MTENDSPPPPEPDPGPPDPPVEPSEPTDFGSPFPKPNFDTIEADIKDRPDLEL